MPFILIYPPQKARLTDGEKIDLRRRLVNSVSRIMKCQNRHVRTILVSDGFPPIEHLDDGASTILVLLLTGMFNGREKDDPQVKKTLEHICSDIFHAYDKKHEVEVSVIPLQEGWIFLQEVE